MAKTFKLYAESHIRKSVTRQLRDKGIDIIRADEVGMADAADLDHLEYSTREERILITYDDDLVSLAAHWNSEGRQHAGIFLVSAEISQAGERGTGPLLKAISFYAEAFKVGAATVEEEIYNQVRFISFKEWR